MSLKNAAKQVCRWLIGTVPGTKRRQENEIAQHRDRIRRNTDKVNKTVRANVAAKLF